MKKYKLATAIILGLVLTVEAQYTAPEIVLDTLMKRVLENNRTILAAREQYEVSLLEAGTGNTPSDPTVELGYLFGNLPEIGNRVDFSVNQQFDFPTSYIQRSRLKDIKSGKAELQYILIRQNVLLQAKQLWIERVYLNKLEKLLSQRLADAELRLDHYRQKLTSGEEGQLLFSQSNLQTMELQREYESVQSRKRNNQVALEEISSGAGLVISAISFPNITIIDADSLLKDYINSPQQQLHNMEQELKEQQKSLAISSNLPKFSAGYYSETVLDQRFKGFQVGLSVPLWENTNRIKKAKSEIVFANADAERFASAQQKEVQQKLEQVHSLDSQIDNLEEALGLVNDEELLRIALEMGEISLSEYLYATELYFRNVQSLFKFKRDRLILEADLLKIYF